MWLLCVKFLLKPRNSHVASCLCFVQQFVRDVIFVFLIPSSNVGTCWHIFQAVNSPVCMETLCNPPSKPFCRSVLITIEIVIDLPYLGSHKVSLTCLALLERQTQLVLQAKVLGAFDVQLAPCVLCCSHDGWSKFWVTHLLPTHPTCSSVGGD